MFVIIVNQILKMLLLLLLGCLCFRMRLIDENGSKVLANLLLMVVNPMLAIVSLQTEYSAHLAQGLLVAYLLDKYDLTIDDVKQHRDFSGKICPSTIIETNRWQDFLNMVQEDYTAQKAQRQQAGA